MTSVVIHPSKKKFTFYGGNSKPIKIGVELGNQLILLTTIISNNCGQLAGVTIVTKKMTKIMTRKMARTRMK